MPDEMKKELLYQGCPDISHTQKIVKLMGGEKNKRFHLCATQQTPEGGKMAAYPCEKRTNLVLTEQSQKHSL